MAGTSPSGAQVGRRKPVIQGGPAGKTLSGSPRAGYGRDLPVATGKYLASHLVEGYVQTRNGQCDAAFAKSLSVVSKVRSCLMQSCASSASIVPS